MQDLRTVISSKLKDMVDKAIESNREAIIDHLISCADTVIEQVAVKDVIIKKLDVLLERRQVLQVLLTVHPANKEIAQTIQEIDKFVESLGETNE